jgi:long-chain fatty acid adenylase/transferase FadD26
MAVIESSIPALLQERASQQPDATAFTFIDYGLDPTGFAESLTWSQVHRRALTVANELRLCGSSGDRAAILAPQGLDYIVAFLGALQAGFIAVPLSVPQFGAHDKRISSALRDCAAAVILTTAAAVDEVRKYAAADGSSPAPGVIEIDSLDLYSPREFSPIQYSRPREAYVQYTSGSTGQPTGVVISHQNLITNCEQVLASYCDVSGPPGSLVSWLPFYHDMGLMLGVCWPTVYGRPAVLMSPVSFLQEPARWMQLLATNPQSFSAAPNFAFELTARSTSDDDMTGLDLGHVLGIINGSERVQPAAIARFNERFARFNWAETAMRPSYGLAEATVYVATARSGQPPKTVYFQYEQLSGGQAKPCKEQGEGGIELISYGGPSSPLMRIVNPETKTENPPGIIGEIWVHGGNVAMGYWRNPELTKRTFGARLATPSPGTPESPWLRTGDLGVISDGELFIIGRIKDLLIVDGRNHYPDDIEATIQQITRGRVAAISVPNETAEQLVAIAELKSRGGSDEESMLKLRSIRREVTSAISNTHRVRVADLVLVPQGSIPITTSGKVRRSACVERYRRDEFERLDVSA